MRRLKSPSINIGGVFFCVAVVCVFGTTAFGQPWDGSGTTEDPYQIWDACDMQAIGADANYWDAHFKLMADIDLSAYTGTSFNIIGASWDNPFTGVFGGNGHTISNFTYDSNEIEVIGLFGCVSDPNAQIKNLGLNDPNVDGRRSAGALVSYLDGGTVTNCYAEGGSVSGENEVGGLVGGSDNGMISGCYSTGTVHGKNDNIGGLVGYNNYGIISNCYSEAYVNGDAHVGGLVGYNEYGVVSKSYSSGTVEGGNSTGGLVGRNDEATISNCYSVGYVTGDSYVGGLVGDHSGIISNCYATGYIQGNAEVGGLIGYNGGTVSNSFWDVQTTGRVNMCGGQHASSEGCDDSKGKTTAEMQTANTFIGWGCEPIWTIDEGVDYPRLWWQNLPGELIISSRWYGGGNGQPNNPYLIYTAEQLNIIGLIECDWDKHFKLMANIDLSSYTETAFNIIGNFGNPFTGVFDGNGHTISNFSYEGLYQNDVGLFRVVDDVNAQIMDFGIVEPNVSFYGWKYFGENCGSLVGHLINGTIIRCWVRGGRIRLDYTGGYHDNNIGGLVGKNNGNIIDCYTSCDLLGTQIYDDIGGLVGVNSGIISNCYSVGNVSGGYRVGGLVGRNDSGEVSNSYSSGGVSGDDDVGGLVGYNYYTDIFASFWDTDTTGQASGVGYIEGGGTVEVYGKTTAQMQMAGTFTSAGWDFVGETINGPNDIWDICEGTNYPKFVWQIPAADFLCPDGVNFIDYAFFAKHWLQPIYGVELTGDGKVNWADFAVFAEYWKLSDCGECGGADFTNDGDVDLKDLSVFAVHWLGTEYAEVDLTNDGQVGLDDLHQFTESWLAGF